MRCSYCGSGLHTTRLCPKTFCGSARRSNLRCSYCGARDHEIQACPKTFDGNAARTWHADSVANHFIKDRR